MLGEGGRMTKIVRIVLATLWSIGAAVPGAAQSLSGAAAYEELLKRADPTDVVEVEGRKYVRTPRTGSGLPGGYDGAYSARKVTLPDGQEVSVVDPGGALEIKKRDKNATASMEMPERGKKIAAAMEKAGLVVKGAALPQAVGGYRLEATIGKEEGGATQTKLFIHFGEPAKLEKWHEFLKGSLISHAQDDNKQVDEMTPAPKWAGHIAYYSPERPPKSILLGPQVRGAGAITGVVAAHAINARRDATVSVTISRHDSMNFIEYNKSLGKLSFDDAGRRARGRCAELAAGLKPDVETWMKTLANIVDEVDSGGAPSAETPVAPPKPQPETPPPPKPSAASPKPPASTAAARVIFPEGRPRTLIGQRLQNWWIDTENYAAAHPNRWAGDCLTHAGGAIIVLGVLVGPVWMIAGATLYTIGLIKYHQTQPGTAPPEPEIVRNSRERLREYQEKWKRGFSDAELNELGVFMQDLGKMTPADRARVYQDAEIDFVNRAEALRQLREAEARRDR